MIEAWFSASEMIASSAPSSGSNRPPLASKHGGEEDRVVLAEPARDPLLELAVQRLRAADEADRGHAEAELVERLARRRDDLGMVGEAEIVVGAEVQELALAALRSLIDDADMRRLRRRDHPLAFEEAVGLDRRRARTRGGQGRDVSWLGLARAAAILNV